MPYDANLILQDTVTATATVTHGPVDLKTRTPIRGLNARLIVSAVSGTTPTLTPVIQSSPDGTNWYNDTSFDRPAINAVGVYDVYVETSNRYLRLVSTITGTTPSFVYRAELGLQDP